MIFITEGTKVAMRDTGGQHHVPGASLTSGEWNSVGDELLSMAAEDLRVRTELAKDGSLFQGYHPRMRAVHDANATRLETILNSLGWPCERQVGHAAAQAAWLIVQHAIAQPGFQRHALELLRKAVEGGDAPALQVAMLEDRIRTFEGRPQRYGTQFDWDAEGQLNPLPIEEPEGVDLRRRQVGLGPLEDAIEAQRKVVGEEGEEPPPDWQARRREMDAWCREVGWRA
ncbi:MAG TPA: DUF6624 domain-containing protein [Gemmatimonadales bacterium]|nr:DUF6624 domain-containing protein [Gemmatimonadales bacterium]